MFTWYGIAFYRAVVKMCWNSNNCYQFNIILLHGSLKNKVWCPESGSEPIKLMLSLLTIFIIIIVIIDLSQEIITFGTFGGCEFSRKLFF